MKKLLFSVIVIGLILNGCNKKVEEEQKTTTPTTKKSESEKDTTITNEVKKGVNSVADEVKKGADTLSKKVVEETKKVEDKIEESKKSLSNVLADVKKDVTNEVDNKKGELLFAKCKACHGVNGELKALNQSQIIKGWSVEKTIKALKGYKDGSYGGKMKGVMKGQVSSLSDKEIEAVAKYISNL